jgi:hypothetical protein
MPTVEFLACHLTVEALMQQLWLDPEVLILFQIFKFKSSDSKVLSCSASVKEISIENPPEDYNHWQERLRAVITCQRVLVLPWPYLQAYSTPVLFDNKEVFPPVRFVVSC